MALASAPPQAAPAPGQLYQLIADTIPHMVWTARADGWVDFHNRRCLDYTGLTHDELRGWDWKRMVHPEDWDRCAASWTRALHTGERYDVEYRLLRADGAYRWHHGTAVPTRDAQGRVERWFGTCTDIEAEVRSAQILEGMVEERTRTLRALLDNEPECVKLLDADGRLLQINAAGLRMVEASGAEQLLNQCVYPLVAEEHRAAFRDLTERVCRGERGTLEFRIVGLKGTPRWLETHAVPFLDEASGETRLLSITRDVTDRKRAEQALLDSQRRFEAFMDQLPALAWIRDAAFRYRYVNRRYAEALGAKPHAMLGREAGDFFPAAVAARFRDSDAQVLRSGVPVQLVDSLPTGQWLKVKFPLPDAGGEAAVAGIALDVTERAQAEERAQRYLDNARSLMKRLVDAQESERRRIADDLHDLIGQNLTALGIGLATLKTHPSAEVRDAVTPRIDAMAGLVEGTIDAIRGVMTDLRPVALEEFGLVAALRWYASVFTGRTGMKMSVSAPAEVRRLAPDAELALFRIVQEALTNAAKHSGGTAVEVAVAEAEGLIRATVEDDGRGFADPVGARGAQRGGWGLPAMRERAEALGGALRVEFPGRGTRVVVEIPALAHGD
jgi:PAS domain S-box-containing protein